jgi:hypothetical protein
MMDNLMLWSRARSFICIETAHCFKNIQTLVAIKKKALFDEAPFGSDV